MSAHRAFVALGSNEGDPRARLAAALAALDRDDGRVAACSLLVWSTYEGAPAAARQARVLNGVAEVRTDLDVDAFHARLHAIEAEHGRARDGRAERTLDLDLLTFDDVARADDDLTLPHPRALQRAFVLGPWSEIAPCHVVAGATVIEHAAALHARVPARFDDLEPAHAPPFAERGGELAILEDRAALEAWRARQEGTVGVVMTMGALHAGHASLVQRAAAECDVVLATVFVNPTQFAEGEDLDRYPRTFEADCDLVLHHGARAIYAPRPEDIYPDGVASDVETGSAAEGYEGAVRPTHFAGVASVVTRLWDQTRADVSYFGQKDAQQLAVLREVRDRLGLPVEIVGGETVREVEGLALSSRNRHLAEGSSRLALRLSRTLYVLVVSAAMADIGGETYDLDRDLTWARDSLQEQGLLVDYVDVVDPDTMTPVRDLLGPALAIGAVRVDGVRLIDNRWIARPPASMGA